MNGPTRESRQGVYDRSTAQPRRGAMWPSVGFNTAAMSVHAFEMPRDSCLTGCPLTGRGRRAAARTRPPSPYSQRDTRNAYSTRRVTSYTALNSLGVRASHLDIPRSKTLYSAGPRGPRGATMRLDDAVTDSSECPRINLRPFRRSIARPTIISLGDIAFRLTFG